VATVAISRAATRRGTRTSALAMVLAATAVAFWLWDKRAGPTERHHEDVIS
jgi:ferric-dicitrate binding protein FerR (iron transport regulator)